MNSIVLLGRATSSIELKQTQAGKSVVSFSLAVKRPFAKDTTDFYTICAWDKTAETIAKYVNKGNLICIRGYLQNRSWEDAQGNKRYATEVVANEVSFCESKGNTETNSSLNAQNGSQGKYEPSTYVPDAYKPNFEAVDNDSDMPF